MERVKSVEPLGFRRRYATESMSLAIPINIAIQDDRTELLLILFAKLQGAPTYHACYGPFATYSILRSEPDDAAKRVAEGSIQYALDGSRGGLREPVAGFIANKSLPAAKLQQLIYYRAPADESTIQRRTQEIFGV